MCVCVWSDGYSIKDMVESGVLRGFGTESMDCLPIWCTQGRFGFSRISLDLSIHDGYGVWLDVYEPAGGNGDNVAYMGAVSGDFVKELFRGKDCF